MISLSVGLVAPDLTCHCQSHVDLADLASEAKKQAKKKLKGTVSLLTVEWLLKARKIFNSLCIAQSNP